MSFLLWILAISAVLLLLRLNVGPLPRRRAFKALFLPGVLVAIVGKLLACALSGSKLQEVNFPWREGDPAKPEESKVPIWGSLCQALVPVLTGAAAVLIAREILVPELIGRIELPDLETHPSAIAVFLDTCRQILGDLTAMANAGELWRWQMALFGYLSFSILAFTSPTWKECDRIKGHFFAAVLSVAAVGWLGLKVGFLSRGWYIRYKWSEPVFEGLGLILTAALAALLATLAVRWSYLLLLAAFKPKQGPPKE